MKYFWKIPKKEINSSDDLKVGDIVYLVGGKEDERTWSCGLVPLNTKGIVVDLNEANKKHNIVDIKWEGFPSLQELYPRNSAGGWEVFVYQLSFYPLPETLSWKKDPIQRIEVTEENVAELNIIVDSIINVGDIIYLNSDNKRHRLNGPAIEGDDGTKIWYQNGKEHRLDGPSAEWNDGDKEWYINGRCLGRRNNGYTQEKFEQYKRENGITSSLKESWKIQPTPTSDDPKSWIGWLVMYDGTFGDRYGVVVKTKRLGTEDEIYSVWRDTEEDAIKAFNDNFPVRDTLLRWHSLPDNDIIPIRYIGTLTTSSSLSIGDRVKYVGDNFHYLYSDGNIVDIDDQEVKVEIQRKKGPFKWKGYLKVPKRNFNDNFIKLASPESYTDKSDIDMDKKEFDERALFLSQEDHLDNENLKQGVPGLEDLPLAYAPSPNVYQPLDKFDNNIKIGWKKEEPIRRIVVTEDNQQELIEKTGWNINIGDILYLNSNNELHRLGGPAIERSNGTKEWYQSNQLHRTDGPALEGHNGTKYWCVNNEFIGSNADGFTEEDFENYKREHNITSSLKFSWKIQPTPTSDDPKSWIGWLVEVMDGSTGDYRYGTVFGSWNDKVKVIFGNSEEDVIKKWKRFQTYSENDIVATFVVSPQVLLPIRYVGDLFSQKTSSLALSWKKDLNEFIKEGIRFRYKGKNKKFLNENCTIGGIGRFKSLEDDDWQINMITVQWDNSSLNNEYSIGKEGFWDVRTFLRDFESID
jgi:hypothetical protein